MAGVWLIEGSCGPESALEGDESQGGVLSEAENEKAASPSASSDPAPEVRGAQGTAAEGGDAAGGHAGAGETAPDADALPFHFAEKPTQRGHEPHKKEQSRNRQQSKDKKDEKLVHTRLPALALWGGRSMRIPRRHPKTKAPGKASAPVP
ncbi:MAG: hypothetical protein V8Q84_10050 [Bilophila sp.]